MKKITIYVFVLVVLAGLLSCRSGPDTDGSPPVYTQKYGSVFIDMVYDPVMLITHNEKIQVVEELQSRLHALGFGIATSADRADILLTVTVDELVLADRNDRLVARGTFGLIKDPAYMTYTAAFVDNKTLDDIVVTTETVKTTKYFPSRDKIKAEFFAEMVDTIDTFISESTVF